MRRIWNFSKSYVLPIVYLLLYCILYFIHGLGKTLLIDFGFIRIISKLTVVLIYSNGLTNIQKLFKRNKVYVET